jgi:predicted nuclease of predicted toxin-antitoxin system
VRFLLDQNRSPRLAVVLTAHGHDAVHTLELGLEQADDDELLEAARNDDRVLISGDTNFGALLALSGETSPSVILDHIEDLAGDLAARGRHRRHG